MPAPYTKLYLSSAISNVSGGYRLLPVANGDFTADTATWVSGIADLNGDGIPEIVTGSPLDDDKLPDAGRIFVNYGTATGGTTTYVDDALTKIVIDGVNTGDLAGSSVGSVTDLNGDGRAEILVGAPAMEVGALTDAGAAFVLWGLAAGGGIDLGDPFSGGGKGYAIKGQAAGDNAGIAVTSIGDLNGDGKAEILVGATGNDAGGTDAGAAYVVWGKSSSSVVNLNNVATGTGGFRIIGEGNNDAIGSALGTVSDLNGDGKAEILIGSQTSEAGGKDSGAAYVVFGKSTGTGVDLSNVASGTGGYRITGMAGDQAGASIAGIGDVNGDGKSDIVVGAAGSGNAYVVYGKSTTTEVQLSDVAAGIGGFMITGEDNGDLANVSVTGGVDLNRDGIKDIVIGASHNSEGGFDAGAVYVVWGGSGASVDLSLVSQGIGGAKIVGTAGSLTGSSVSIIGDMNGDGTADLLIGNAGGTQGANIVYTPTSWQPDPNIYGTSADDVMGAGYGNALHQIGAGNDQVMGLAGNDTIQTGAGNDSIDGGSGSDTMSGGLGDDTYYVDSATDVVIENAGEGTDTVIASVACTLGANVENLILDATAHSGTGNELNNTLTGNSGADTLDGAAGADTMIGGLGNDTYVVDNAGDIAQEVAGQGTDTVLASIDWTLGANLENLTLTGAARVAVGNTQNNVLTGTAFADTLNGGAGNDTMNGGAGDDTYIVDSVSDVVNEGAGAGNDTVISSVNLTLGANVENLTLSGAARVATGNALDNTLTGTAFADTLNGGLGADSMKGGAGDDTYYVDNLGDTITENDGEGTDTVITSLDYALNAGASVENITLSGAARHATGNEKVNSLTGTSGDDVLDGGAGADTLTGGLGNDTYVVDDAADTVVEAAAAGTDKVEAYADYTLSANIEELVLKGSAHTGTGNDQDNKLTGGIGNDTLYGMGGNDTIDGGAGADTMVGGDGNDTYYIDNAGDVIVETVGGGTDTVIVNADYVLTNDNIESVHVIGTGHSVTGSVGNNTLSGSSGDDTLDGGDGDDLEVGGDGDDKLVSSSGHDSMSGGAGDDTFVVKGGHVEIEDFQGHDTIDASEATGNSYIDLSGDTTSHIEDQDCTIGHGGSTLAPLDVQFLQDLSGSFGDDIAMVRTLVPNIVAALQTVQANSQFGSSTFVDKAVNPFGATGEWVYNTLLSQTSDTAALTSAYNNMVIRYGNDEPEAQLEALMQLALHQSEVGFRPDSARFVILFTDAPYHVAGDGALGGITTPNNGDAVMDGVVPGTGEDYPMIAQVKAALEAANIIPIFAIANGYESVYQGLTTGLGRGAVVSLSADSANVVSAITAGLTAATVTTIEDAKGGAGDDTINGNDAANALTGNAGNDTLKGAHGNDTLAGGLGEDTAVYDGAFSSYTIKTTSSYVTVTDINVADGDDGVDTLTSIENYVFKDGSAHLTTSTFDGTVGNDALTAMNNNAWTIHGFDGNDLLKGRSGNDTIFGDNGSDTIYGKEGNDSITGGLGTDKLYGDGGDDHFYVSGKLEGYDRYDGGLGVDTIHAATNSTQIGLTSFTGIEAITADGHTDVTIRGTSSAETMDFSTVTLTGISYINSGSGNDTLIGSAGADTLKGDAGDDIINGGAGVDNLYGGLGADTFVFDLNALTSRDAIRDFSLGQGDKIEINGLLEGYDPVTSAITDFVKISDNGVNSYLYVDKDGASGPSSFVQIGRIDATVGLTDEQSLVNTGHLLVA